MCPCIVDIVGPRPLRPQSPPPGQRGKGLFEQMIPEIMTPLKTVYQQHISKINTEAKRFSGASHLGKVQEYSEIGQVGRRGGGTRSPRFFTASMDRIILIDTLHHSARASQVCKAKS